MESDTWRWGREELKPSARYVSITSSPPHRRLFDCPQVTAARILVSPREVVALEERRSKCRSEVQNTIILNSALFRKGNGVKF